MRCNLSEKQRLSIDLIYSVTRFHQDKNSRHTHTTDDNDIRPHAIQEHNERTCTEFNLVTA
jgi:hypothetical protein